MDRYVKFQPSLIDKVEAQLSSSFPVDYESLYYILCRLKQKENCVIETSDIEELGKIANFNVKRHIICYYERESEDIEQVKVKRVAIELVEHKLRNTIEACQGRARPPFDVRLVKNLLNSRDDNIFAKSTLYRIELLTGMHLRKHIIDTMIIFNKSNKLKALTNKQECDIMYSVARELSNRFNYGYSLNYNSNTLRVDKDKSLVFYWNKGALYCNKKLIGNLLESVKDISKVIDKIMKK